MTIIAVHNRTYEHHVFDLPEDRIILQGWLKSVQLNHYTFYKERIRKDNIMFVLEVLEVVG